MNPSDFYLHTFQNIKYSGLSLLMVKPFVHSVLASADGLRGSCPFTALFGTFVSNKGHNSGNIYQNRVIFSTSTANVKAVALKFTCLRYSARRDREAKTHNSNKGHNSGNIITWVINSSIISILSVKAAALKCI